VSIASTYEPASCGSACAQRLRNNQTRQRAADQRVAAIASAPVLSPILLRFRAFANRDRGSVNEAWASARIADRWQPAMRSEVQFLPTRPALGIALASKRFLGKCILLENTEMADNKSKRGSPDRDRIDVNDPNELRNWSQSLNRLQRKSKTLCELSVTLRQRCANTSARASASDRLHRRPDLSKQGVSRVQREADLYQLHVAPGCVPVA